MAENKQKLIETELLEAQNLYDTNPLEIKEQIDKLCDRYKLPKVIKLSLGLFTHRFMTYQIVNGVAPIKTGIRIDKNKVIEGCIKNNLNYRKHEKFSGIPVIFNEEGIKFTAVFFKSGSINLIGLSGDSLDFLEKVIKILKKYELDLLGTSIVQYATKRVSNRVYALSIPKTINLTYLHLFNELSIWKNIKYNSQSFPGVIQKFQSHKSKALFFKTGSVIVTGITSTLCKVDICKEMVNSLGEYLSLSLKNPEESLRISSYEALLNK